MTSRPQWMRCDLDLFDNPKMLGATYAVGPAAIGLYLQGLAYAVRWLTDGWVPAPMPAMWRATESHIKALEQHGLWIPLEVTDDGGWLINDFPEYQVTRDEWASLSERNSRNAKKRWAKRQHLRSVPDDSPA